jgi:phosphoserine phosphatase RsbU/P
MAPAKTAIVTIVEPNGTRREMPLAPLPFRIGRQAGNELTLRDSRVSRQQAQIVELDGAFILEDLGSRHGTFVNGEKILKHELKAGDRVEFGVPDSYQLLYIGDEDSATIGDLVGRIDAPAPQEAGPRELHHLGVLLDVARTLSSGLSLEDILTAVVDAAIQLTRTERGVLLIKNSAGELQTAVARNAQKTTLRPEEIQVSKSIVKRVANTQREMIATDEGANAAGVVAAGAGGPGALTDSSMFDQSQSMFRLSLRTIVAIPVAKLPVIEMMDATIPTRQSELLGVLYLDSRAPSSAFSALDREVLATLAREAATVVENARLFADARAKARLDHEIEIASQIQQRLLPKELPNLPGIAVAGSTLACYSVGGDCFDVIPLDRGRLGFFVGDISGKGISAALLATLLQGIFFTTASMDLDLPSVFAKVNRYLCEHSSEERYATVFYGVLDKSGRFDYVNAGHVPPMVRRTDGSIDALGSENLPVGLFEEAEYKCSTVNLSPGEFFVIYTDGVSEAVNVRSEMFEETGLRKVLEKFNGQAAGELAHTIQGDLRAFTQGAAQSDDITMLVVQYKGDL